ncbi:MAG: hypothetical protein KKB37_00975 [Alphaproteobacteria bacterium]|nr:hypothetical protein [Alphaproteobacteria bacterium]
MTIKSALLIGCLLWAAAGAGILVTRDAGTSETRVASTWFQYTTRTPLTP